MLAASARRSGASWLRRVASGKAKLVKFTLLIACTEARGTSAQACTRRRKASRSPQLAKRSSLRIASSGVRSERPATSRCRSAGSRCGASVQSRPKARSSAGSAACGPSSDTSSAVGWRGMPRKSHPGGSPSAASDGNARRGGRRCGAIDTRARYCSAWSRRLPPALSATTASAVVGSRSASSASRHRTIDDWSGCARPESTRPSAARSWSCPRDQIAKRRRLARATASIGPCGSRSRATDCGDCASWRSSGSAGA